MRQTYKSILIIIFLLFNNLINAQSITGGQSSSLALCTNGLINGVGNNFNGQLGNGANQYATYSTVQTSGLTGIVALKAGIFHTLFLKNDGTVWAVGKNNKGQLGDGTLVDKNIPIQISGLSNIIAIDGGGDFSLFLKSNGTIWAVGYNGYGQLADGTLIDKNIPFQIPTLTGIVAIASGGNHSLFLKNDGTVWAVGRNNFGQLGNGTTLQYNNTPFQIPNLNGIIALDAGGSFSVFFKNNGTVWATGENGYGQIGDGNFSTIVTTPVQVLGLSGITSLHAGTHHALYLKNDNTVWAVGYNTSGTLGDGTFTHRNIPVQVLSSVIEIACADFHSLFVKNDNTVWVTGDNDSGQLGDGTNVDKNLPIQITSFCNSSLGTNDSINIDFDFAYPNPVKDILNFKTEHSILKIEIYDIAGRIINSNKVSENKVDLSVLKTGNYLLKLYTGKGIINTKIIKE